MKNSLTCNHFPENILQSMSCLISGNSLKMPVWLAINSQKILSCGTVLKSLPECVSIV